MVSISHELHELYFEWVLVGGGFAAGGAGESFF
jgi:hypothetical protein